MGDFGIIFKTLDSIAATSSTNGKIALLEGLIKKTVGDSTFGEMVRYTYDPKTNYYMAPEMPTTSADVEMSDEQLTAIWGSVKNALDAMSQRTLSGNDAKRTMQMVLEALPPTPRKYFFAIFNRDLRIGIASRTLARYFPGLMADSRVYLCKKFDAKADPKFNTITFPQYVETKFDGVRAVMIVDETGEPTAYSREMKPFWNWELIGAAIKASGLKSVVLDGEFGIPEDFTLTNAVTRTQKIHPMRDKMKYFIFDAMPLNHWNSAGKDEAWPIERRKALANECIAEINNPLVLGTNSVLVHNREEFKAIFELFVEQGFEGVVFKKPGSVYRFDGKRDSNWMKWKPIEEADVVVTGAERGDQDGWAYNTCGKLLFKGYVEKDGELYYVEGKVGSGLKPSDRDKYWSQNNLGTLADTVIEIEYQEPCEVLDASKREVITYNAKGERIWSLRFPVFKRERPDKSAEQVMTRKG